jgi:hypothetical protein
MICVRCGYCCTSLLAVIVVDPELGIREDNLRGINMLEERCPHLCGDEPGGYSCAIHDRPWFKDTPCAEYQSHWPDQTCRLGAYLIENKAKWRT